MFQIASQSASVAGRIFIVGARNCRRTGSVAAIPAATGAQITQRARRAFGLRAMVGPLLAPIARDLVSPVSYHRWTVSIAQPRWGKRRVRGELQCESHGPAKFPPPPIEITGLRGHARECAGLRFYHLVRNVTGTVACHPWLGADFHC